MAIRKETIDLMDIGCRVSNRSFQGLKICELGNQRTKDHRKYRTAKQYLESLGAEHVSIDLNGEDGAIPLDLSKPINTWNGYFDMLTNYGTAEHVDEQYTVFKNIHNLTARGGVMVHVAPMVGYWEHHGNCNYSSEFFEELAELNRYSMFLNEKREKVSKRWKKKLFNVCVVMGKQENIEFMPKEEFDNLKGLVYNAT